MTGLLGPVVMIAGDESPLVFTWVVLSVLLTKASHVGIAAIKAQIIGITTNLKVLVW